MARRKPRSLRESIPGFRRLGHHVRPHLRTERTTLLLGLLALVAEVCFRLLEPWPLKYVIDGVVAASGATVAGQPAGNLTLLLVLASVALLAITLLRAGASYLSTLACALSGSRLLSKVRADLFEHLQRLPMSFHDSARTGDLVTRVTADVGRLKEVAVTAALPLFGNALTLVAMVVVVAFMDWRLALVMLVVFPAFFSMSLRLGRRIHSVSRLQRSAEGSLASHATESLASMRLIKSYSLEHAMQETFSSSNEKSMKDGVKAKRLSAGLERKTDVLVGIATSITLFAGAQRVLAGAMTPGELVVFLTYLKAAFKPMRDVAKYVGRISQAAASSERIVEILDEVPGVVDRPQASPAPTLSGRVELCDVWLEYAPGHPALRGVDLVIPAGQRIALLGPSGAGKSSLAMLLSRLCDPSQGHVSIDGIDLRDMTVESLRRQTAVVLQESVLFATSISENIAYGSAEGSPARVREAALVAGAHDFIRRLPAGYDTIVGERGATLSGGERQRIAIARAAMRRAPIVILDEAMAGLDRETEAEVYAALERLTRDCTTIMISHDLDSALTCERALWLEDGRIVDDGRPDTVLARRAGGSHARR